MSLARLTFTRGWDAVLDACAPVQRAEAAAAHVTLSIIETREGFDALEADWNDLFSRTAGSAHVFQAFNWNWHWANAFLGRGCKLAVVTGRRDGRLVMVWPLVAERVGGLRILAWMGEPVSQYGDVLAEPGPGRMAMLRDAWRYIAATLKPDLARLNKTRADSIIAPLLAELGALSTQRLEAPYLDLASAPSWEAYASRYSNKARKNRSRQWRRLEDKGPVLIRKLAPGPEAARLAAAAIVLKHGWLKDKGVVSPALSDERTARFFEAVASDGDHPAGTRVSVLTCCDATAAIEIAFSCRDRLAIHIMAYDPAFEKAAAGVLLLESLLAASHEAGVATYDLMAPGDGYKKEWADGSVMVDDFAVPSTLAGQAYARAYLAWLRPRLKQAVTRGSRLAARLRGRR